MALTEIKERRGQERISDPRFTGQIYIRVFECPKGEVDTHLATTLAKGTVLPAACGGPATSLVTDPRLQTVTRYQQPGGAMDELTATYISIDT